MSIGDFFAVISWWFPTGYTFSQLVDNSRLGYTFSLSKKGREWKCVGRTHSAFFWIWSAAEVTRKQKENRSRTQRQSELLNQCGSFHWSLSWWDCLLKNDWRWGFSSMTHLCFRWYGLKYRYKIWKDNPLTDIWSNQPIFLDILLIYWFFIK